MDPSDLLPQGNVFVSLESKSIRVNGRRAPRQDLPIRNTDSWALLIIIPK